MSKNLDQELETALGETDSPDADSPAVAAPVSPKGSAKKKGNIALLISLLAMALGVVVLFLVGFKEAAVYAMPADEVVAKAGTLNGKRLRVDGELVPGTLVKRAARWMLCRRLRVCTSRAMTFAARWMTWPVPA